MNLHTLSFILILLLLWLGLNGFGNISFCAVVILFTYLLASGLKLLPKTFIFNYKIVLYFFWLIKEIAQSTVSVIKVVWSYRMKTTPTFEWIESIQNTDLGLVIYANSITLTPGTVTLDIKGNKLLVHALEKSSINELKNMDLKVMKSLN